MKGFGKCLKMDLQSVWGEVTVACATVLIFFLFDANPLLIPISYYSPSYFFTIPTVMIVAYCFFRVFKRLFYTCMFTDGAVLYKTLPISEKCDAMSKFVTAAAALMILQFILLALQWYVLHCAPIEYQSNEFKIRAVNVYNAFMDALGGTILKIIAASFAFAAMVFAAIAIYQTARNKSGGGKFLAVLAAAGVSFAVAGITEAITNAFDLGAGAAGAAEAVIWTIVMLCCLRIVLQRVSRG